MRFAERPVIKYGTATNLSPWQRMTNKWGAEANNLPYVQYRLGRPTYNQKAQLRSSLI
jgi:hypothetical protein